MKKKMNNKEVFDDGLKVTQNENNSFSLEWDAKDPNWKWLNELTDEQITVIVQEAIKSKLEELNDELP